ncbi:hypothetical protein PUN28_003668 [Cardiocondyla obscurior]|uniref:Uncharacterized protein n=1 Tax=Cardiocondyla obscurior TaxID=286306 RepID=A0AAW2GJU5_9HYME
MNTRWCERSLHRKKEKKNKRNGNLDSPRPSWRPPRTEILRATEFREAARKNTRPLICLLHDRATILTRRMHDPFMLEIIIKLIHCQKFHHAITI